MDSIKEQRIIDIENIKLQFEKNISDFQKAIDDMKFKIQKCDEEIAILKDDRVS